MEHQRGFTILEIVVGMLILSAAVIAVLPPITQALILGDVLWERRLALKIVEAKLEETCQEARTASGFDNAVIPVTNSLANLPAELLSATWTRQVDCLNPDLSVKVSNCAVAGENLKRVQVTVNWVSRGRDVNESSADCLVSKTGVCGTGA